MKRVVMPIAAAAVLSCSPAWAQSAFSQPWGMIESGDRSATRNEEPVAIARIDGQSTRNPRRPDPIAPGKHSVEISFTSARAVVGDDLKTIEIDVEPCKRYRVAARYHTATSGRWDPVVQSVEDIGECRKKFMSGSPKK